MQSTKELLIEKEEEFYQQKKDDFVTKDLKKLEYKKFKATCTNNVEQYEYKVIKNDVGKDGARKEVIKKVEILI